MESEKLTEDDASLPSNSDADVSTSADPPSTSSPRRRICIAIAGCSHGEMDTIYATLGEIERRDGLKADLLISCGDYQAVRNYGDLHHMHVNEKYRQLQTFHRGRYRLFLDRDTAQASLVSMLDHLRKLYSRYYSGSATAPVLTLFIGGNHESSGYMAELPYGGWVAPRIFYMGFASVVKFAGLRIAGLSGIYKQQDYNRGHFERPPFREGGSLISAYHVRSLEVFRLKQLRSRQSTTSNPENDEKLVGDRPPIDIMISHDWPCGITDYGDVERLLRIKPHFHDDIQRRQLGNPHGMTLLHELRPRYWFSAHLHVKFAAIVPHKQDDAEIHSNDCTRFLALDKPIPRRNFLQLLEFEVEEGAECELAYDVDWLAILRATNALSKPSMHSVYMPGPGGEAQERWDFRPTDEELAAVDALFPDGNYRIPEDFRRTAPPHRDETPASTPSLYYRNPQTRAFCERFGVRDLNEALCEMNADGLGQPWFLVENCERENVDEIPLDDEDGDFGADAVVIDRNPDPVTITDKPVNAMEDFIPPAFVDSSATMEHGKEGENGKDEPVPKMRRRNAALYEETESTES